MQRHARSAVVPVQPMEVSMNPRLLLAGTAACAVLFASFAHAQSTTTDPGFVPGTGQINPGHALQPPPTTPAAPIANPADVRAALLMPDPETISLGEDPNAGGKAQPVTTGKGITSGEQPGPIASTMQTKPAKFSHRNDVIDHMPTMGMPLRLDEKQRQQIFQAITSEKTPDLQTCRRRALRRGGADPPIAGQHSRHPRPRFPRLHEKQGEGLLSVDQNSRPDRGGYSGRQVGHSRSARSALKMTATSMTS